MPWPWNRGQRSLKVIESGTIRKIAYGFLLVFFSNITSPKHTIFWDIRLQKCSDLENRVRVRQGHSNVTMRQSAYDFLLTFHSKWPYLVSFLTYSLSKNVVTLKSGSEVTQGHWKWHSVDTVWFLLVFFSNFVPEMHRFWDIWLQKCRDLENRVRGRSRSLEISPFDRARTTSYWRSRVTMALSRVVSGLFNVEKCRDLEIGVRGHSRSLKVVPFGRSCIVSY